MLAPVSAIVLGCDLELGGLVVRQLLRSNFVAVVYALSEEFSELAADLNLAPHEAVRLRHIVHPYDNLETTLASLAGTRRIIAFGCTGLSYLMSRSRMELYKHNFDYPVRMVSALVSMDLIRVEVLSSVWRTSRYRSLMTLELTDIWNNSWFERDNMLTGTQPSIAVFSAPVLVAGGVRKKGPVQHLCGTKPLPQIELLVQRGMRRFAQIDKPDYRISVRDVARAMFVDAREYVHLYDCPHAGIHVELLRLRDIAIEGGEMEELASTDYKNSHELSIEDRLERRMTTHFHSKFKKTEFTQNQNIMQIADDAFGLFRDHPLFKFRPDTTVHRGFDERARDHEPEDVQSTDARETSQLLDGSGIYQELDWLHRGRRWFGPRYNISFNAARAPESIAMAYPTGLVGSLASRYPLHEFGGVPRRPRQYMNTYAMQRTSASPETLFRHELENGRSYGSSPGRSSNIMRQSPSSDSVIDESSEYTGDQQMYMGAGLTYSAGPRSADTYAMHREPEDASPVHTGTFETDSHWDVLCDSAVVRLHPVESGETHSEVIVDPHAIRSTADALVVAVETEEAAIANGGPRSDNRIASEVASSHSRNRLRAPIHHFRGFLSSVGKLGENIFLRPPMKKLHKNGVEKFRVRPRLRQMDSENVEAQDTRRWPGCHQNDYDPYGLFDESGAMHHHGWDNAASQVQQ